MSITASQLVIYGALNISEVDGTSTQGGGIDETCRYVFDDPTNSLSPNDTVKIISSASDTGINCVIYGRLTSGALTSETLVLNGPTPVAGSVTFERILRVTLASSCVGNITLKKSNDVPLLVIEPGVLQVRSLFIDAYSTTLQSKAYYEKIFYKNTHPTLSLLSATITEVTDSVGQITFALETSVNGNNSIVSRLNTVPTAVGSFDNTDKAVAGTNLAAGAAQGIWVKLILDPANVVIKNLWSIGITGRSI